MSNQVKQVIVVRSDLNMRRGKSEAQVAHASLKAVLDQLGLKKWQYEFHDKKKANEYQALLMKGDFNEEVAKDFIEENAKLKTVKCDTELKVEDPLCLWLSGNYKKISLSCDSLDELLELESKAKDANIPYALIEDSGLTEFKEPTIICLAIGPWWSNEIDKITGHLKLR